MPKTLGEIDSVYFHDGNNFISYYVVSIDSLKKEVIKWIKLYEKHTNDIIDIDRLVEGKIAGLKHFFNITDEDLK